MNTPKQLGFAVVISAATLLTFSSGVEGDSSANERNLCQSGWSRATSDDAFELATSSEACWGSGNVRNAISMYLLARLRLKTDAYFLSADLEADESSALTQLRFQLEVLEDTLGDHARHHARAFAEALNYIAELDPELPPFYMPRLELSGDTDRYGQELWFQRAALLAPKRLSARLALDPEWHTLTDEAEKMQELMNEDHLDSWGNNEDFASLQSRIMEVWRQASSEMSDQAGTDQIEVIVRSYGIYLPDGEPEASDGGDVAHGLFLDFDDYIHIETTDRIPVRFGESYGLEIELAGVPVYSPIQLEWSMHHNSLPGADGKPLTHSRNQFERQSFDGTLSLGQFFTFVEDLPVACGPWQVDLLYEGEVLVSQIFQVYGCD